MDSVYPAPHLQKHLEGLAVQDADVHALDDVCDSRGAQSLVDVARSTMTWQQRPVTACVGMIWVSTFEKS